MLYREPPGKPVKITNLTLLLITLLFVSACSSLPSEPLWFNKISQEEGVILGYGSGKDATQSLQQAYRAITQQIEVDVSSQTAFIRQSENDQLTTQTREVTQLKSSRTLKNVQTVQQEQIGDQHFIALQYDQRPLEVVLRSKLVLLGHTSPSFSGSPVLTHSRLLKALDSDARESSLPVSLQRKEGQWHLVVADLLQPIDDLDPITSWDFNKDPEFTIELLGKSESRLKSGEEFHLSVTVPYSIKFLTLFNVYSDGRVVALLDNKTLTESTLIYPELPYLLEASPIIPYQADRDLYLAIGTERKIDTTLFRKSSDRPESGESSYNLDTFINWLTEQTILSISPLYVEIYP